MLVGYDIHIHDCEWDARDIQSTDEYNGCVGGWGAIALIKLLLQCVRETERIDVYRQQRETHRRTEIKYTGIFSLFTGKRLRLERRYGFAVTKC